MQNIEPSNITEEIKQPTFESYYGGKGDNEMVQKQIDPFPSQ